MALDAPPQSHTAAAHPLDPLSGEEIEAAVRILRSARGLGEQVRFVSVELREPSKDTVEAFRPGDPIDRRAFVVLLDRADGATYEAVVSIGGGDVHDWQLVPGVQPAIMPDEFVECEAAVKASPEFREALRKRGIDDLDLVMTDPWSVGYFGLEEESTTRLARALSWVRDRPGDNGYARPVEGVIPVVDLNTMQVLRVEDHGLIPLPPQAGNYTPDEVGPLRDDLRPIEIRQPEGISFEIAGNQVRWQRWRLRVGFTPREGLVLHTVGYEDEGRLRPVLYRASFAEMVVPYGDPSPSQHRKNAFDIGEYGIGAMANSLELGCDCLGEIRYLDAHLCDSRGNAIELKNAVCLHEEDVGMLWKHVDWRTGQTEVRRSRRLVVSSVATVGNYEYGFYWYLYQEGTIEAEVKLTGILSTSAAAPGEQPAHGTLVAPQLNAPHHQHFFAARLDMSVDGERNSVYELETEGIPGETDNPYGNAFRVARTPLRRESEAQRLASPLTARSWLVVNPSQRNALGEPVGYRLVPGENVLPFAQPGSSLLQRAAFITRHLWVTPYAQDERYPAGDYPNQHRGGAGLPDWTSADRAIEDTDVVVWYTFGHHHVARPEEWPVMPVARIGFSLKPHGFFDRNPGLDVPPPPGHACCLT
ncbi:MAG: primary-amine oxidase [Gaiellales bacterium]